MSNLDHLPHGSVLIAYIHHMLDLLHTLRDKRRQILKNNPITLKLK